MSITDMPHPENYLPALYYTDDGGVCDEEQRFCAWSRELWKAWVADKPELPQTWEAEWQRGKAAIEAVEA